jgi:hypothetical protein
MQYATLREKISAEKADRIARYSKFSEIVQQAHEAGEKAGIECRPLPMGIADTAGNLIDIIDDGACGFAWVTIKPANSSFAVWAKKQGLARSAYGGGVMIWVRGFGQSVERKTAYAGAYAKVLRDNGIKASAGDRLD